MLGPNEEEAEEFEIHDDENCYGEEEAYYDYDSDNYPYSSGHDRDLYGDFGEYDDSYDSSYYATIVPC